MNANGQGSNFVITEELRKDTFSGENWKCKKFTPLHLADAGFVYAGEGSMVKCSTCDLVTDIEKWFQGENPSQAHARLQPTCQFVIENYFRPNTDTQQSVMRASSAQGSRSVCGTHRATVDSESSERFMEFPIGSNHTSAARSCTGIKS